MASHVNIDALTENNITLVNDPNATLTALKSKLAHIQAAIKSVQESEHIDQQILGAYKLASKHVASLITKLSAHINSLPDIQESVPVVLTAHKKKMQSIPEPESAFQMDMFRTFISNAPNDMSNTIEQWDSIPKYCLTAAQVKKLRTPDGLAKSFTRTYTNRERDRGGKEQVVNCSLSIQPAQITTKGKDGIEVELAYFPGQTEELIEEILRKILLDQQLGVHSTKGEQTWVKFTLRMIEKELKALNKSRGWDEIKRSLQIMKRCNLHWIKNGKAAYSGGIILELLEVDREDWEEDGNSMWAARLSSLVSLGINNLRYRQLNYARLTSLDDSLSRWIYRRMINRFRQASATETYSLSFSELQQSSGLLEQANDRSNRRKVSDSLQELITKGVINEYSSTEKKDGKKIIDVVYEITPSPKFITEQIAGNKRTNQMVQDAQQRGIQIN